MIKLEVKPLSVNKAWEGQRRKTAEYRNFIHTICSLLPPGTKHVPKGKIELVIDWGFSNEAADIDNPAKLFIDCLQRKYGINDKNIYKLTLTKSIVKKGQEYIKFNAKEL